MPRFNLAKMLAQWAPVVSNPEQSLSTTSSGTKRKKRARKAKVSKA